MLLEDALRLEDPREAWSNTGNKFTEKELEDFIMKLDKNATRREIYDAF